MLNPRMPPMEGPLLARFTDRGNAITQLRSGESDSSGTLFHSPSAQESGASRMGGSVPGESLSHSLFLEGCSRLVLHCLNVTLRLHVCCALSPRSCQIPCVLTYCNFDNSQQGEVF